MSTKNRQQLTQKQNPSKASFRFGVLTSICEKNATFLTEFVAEKIANQAECQLNALELIELGAIYINGVRCLNPSYSLTRNDQVRIHSVPRRFQRPPDLRERVVEETEDYLIVDKPCGLPTDPTVDNLKENLRSYCEDAFHQNLFTVNSLEIESDGLIVLTKNQIFREQLSKAFRDGVVKRVYAVFTLVPLPFPVDSPFSILSSEERKGETSLICEGRKTWIIAGTSLASYHRTLIEFSHLRPKELRNQLAALGIFILGSPESKVPIQDMQTGQSTLAFTPMTLKF
jgi:23S rRNA-/tRNA-specific pseudouridylate synthase